MKILKIMAIFAGVGAAGIYVRAQEQNVSADQYNSIIQNAMKGSSGSAPVGKAWDARIKKVSGSVKVKTEDSPDWMELEGELPLDFDDSVKTASDGSAEIYLDDKGSITVGRNTELIVASLDPADSSFELKIGSLVAKIHSFLEKKMKLEVRTPSAVCAVRGTEFAVEYSQLGHETAVAVYDEGKVAVSAMDDKGTAQDEYLLEKNSELVFNPGQKRFKAVPLARMSRYKPQIALMRLRINAIKRTWKRLSPAKRDELRSRMLKRHVAGKKKATVRRLKKVRRAGAAGYTRKRVPRRTP